MKEVINTQLVLLMTIGLTNCSSFKQQEIAQVSIVNATGQHITLKTKHHSLTFSPGHWHTMSIEQFNNGPSISNMIQSYVRYEHMRWNLSLKRDTLIIIGDSTYLDEIKILDEPDSMWVGENLYISYETNFNRAIYRVEFDSNGELWRKAIHVPSYVLKNRKRRRRHTYHIVGRYEWYIAGEAIKDTIPYRGIENLPMVFVDSL